MNIQSTHLAVDEHKHNIGVLIEFFYIPGSTRLVHAVEIMKRIGADGKKGRPHGVRINVRACSALNLENPTEWWIQTLIFDALIGNTDRHLENWGFLRQAGAEERQWSFAPIFDSATSLGYQISEDGLAKASMPDDLASFVKRGKHHCGWDHLDDGPHSHIELCQRFVDTYPEVRTCAQQMLTFRMDEIDALLNDCVNIDVAVPFTEMRAQFMSKLIGERRRRLVAAIGG